MVTSTVGYHSEPSLEFELREGDHDDVIKWNIFRVTGPLCGEFTGPGEFPTQRPVTRTFDVFFDLRLNKRLSKQPWGWWFETPSWSLWSQSRGVSTEVGKNVVIITSFYVKMVTMWNTSWVVSKVISITSFYVKISYDVKYKQGCVKSHHHKPKKDVLLQDLVKSRIYEIGSLNYRIAMKFDRHLGNTAAEVTVKFQSDRTILNTNLAASRLREILK